MKHRKLDPLLKDLLAEDSLERIRRQSMQQGMAIARRRRFRTNWAKGGLISVFLVATFSLLMPTRQMQSLRNRIAGGSWANTGVVVSPTPPAKNPAGVRFISDEELFALFPGRSLALVGPPGSKTLVFLEPSLQKESNEPDPSRP